jgi:cytochrome c553
LPNLQTTMDDHFVAALELQLAIMAGDLEQVHATAAELEIVPEGDQVPNALPFLSRIHTAAGRAKVASTLTEAGRAAGDVALACGECHSASGGGPKDAVPPAPDAPHMASHVYGAYWMWFGVFAPDERAWKAGSTALAASRLTSDAELPTPGTPHQDEAVHALAQRAVTATDPAAQAAILGELLVACSTCHVQRERP